MAFSRTTQPGTCWRVFLWVVVILCLVYLPLFFGQIVFFRDIAHWTVPARAFLRDSFARSELPVWNPLQAVGFPVQANPLYGVFYPPNWLFLLVSSGRVAIMQTWLDFAHLLWGSAGVFLLARRLRGTGWSAGVAALAALTGPQEPVERMVAEFRRRRDVIVAGLNRLPGVRCLTPRGAFYAFPNIEGTGLRARELADRLLEEAGVATLAGTAFGAGGEGFLRLSYATSLEQIEQALARMGEFLASL